MSVSKGVFARSTVDLSGISPSISLVGTTSGRGVIVHVTWYHPSTQVINSLSIGGQAASPWTQMDGALHGHQWWYLTALSSGGDKTIQPTFNATVDYCGIVAQEVYDFDTGYFGDIQTTGITGVASTVFEASFTTAHANSAAFCGMSTAAVDISADANMDITAPFVHLFSDAAATWHPSVINYCAGFENMDCGAAGVKNVAGMMNASNSTAYCNIILLKPVIADSAAIVHMQ